MDVLSDILASMRIESSVLMLVHFEAVGAWGYRVGSFEGAKFVLVSQGSCVLGVEGLDSPLRLSAGDCYVLPYGSAHTIQDHLESPLRAASEDMPRREREGQVVRVRVGRETGERSTVLVVGRFVLNALNGRPVLGGLPPVIPICSGHTSRLAFDPLLRMLVEECQREATPGSDFVACRLAELLLAQAVRVYMESRQSSSDGPAWFRALSDPKLGVAMQSFHDDPAADWTVASLASEAAMSRSAFAHYFKEVVGAPPMTYITQRRMEMAARLLRESDEGLAMIAARVGYGSEAALSRAFQRIWGVTPGRWRVSQLSSEDGTP